VSLAVCSESLPGGEKVDTVSKSGPAATRLDQPMVKGAGGRPGSAPLPEEYGRKCPRVLDSQGKTE